MKTLFLVAILGILSVAAAAADEKSKEPSVLDSNQQLNESDTSPIQIEQWQHLIEIYNNIKDEDVKDVLSKPIDELSRDEKFEKLMKSAFSSGDGVCFINFLTYLPDIFINAHNGTIKTSDEAVSQFNELIEKFECKNEKHSAIEKELKDYIQVVGAKLVKKYADELIQKNINKNQVDDDENIAASSIDCTAQLVEIFKKIQNKHVQKAIKNFGIDLNADETFLEFGKGLQSSFGNCFIEFFIDFPEIFLKASNGTTKSSDESVSQFNELFVKFDECLISKNAPISKESKDRLRDRVANLIKKYSNELLNHNVEDKNFSPIATTTANTEVASVDPLKKMMNTFNQIHDKNIKNAIKNSRKELNADGTLISFGKAVTSPDSDCFTQFFAHFQNVFIKIGNETITSTDDAVSHLHESYKQLDECLITKRSIMRKEFKERIRYRAASLVKKYADELFLQKVASNNATNIPSPKADPLQQFKQQYEEMADEHAKHAIIKFGEELNAGGLLIDFGKAIYQPDGDCFKSLYADFPNIYMKVSDESVKTSDEAASLFEYLFKEFDSCLTAKNSSITKEFKDRFHDHAINLVKKYSDELILKKKNSNTTSLIMAEPYTPIYTYSKCIDCSKPNFKKCFNTLSGHGYAQFMYLCNGDSVFVVDILSEYDKSLKIFETCLSGIQDDYRTFLQEPVRGHLKVYAETMVSIRLDNGFCPHITFPRL